MEVLFKERFYKYNLFIQAENMKWHACFLIQCFTILNKIDSVFIQIRAKYFIHEVKKFCLYVHREIFILNFVLTQVKIGLYGFWHSMSTFAYPALPGTARAPKVKGVKSQKTP